MCKNFMVIRHSVKELLAKNSVTRPMKYIVDRYPASFQCFIYPHIPYLLDIHINTPHLLDSHIFPPVNNPHIPVPITDRITAATCYIYIRFRVMHAPGFLFPALGACTSRALEVPGNHRCTNSHLARKGIINTGESEKSIMKGSKSTFSIHWKSVQLMSERMRFVTLKCFLFQKK